MTQSNVSSENPKALPLPMINSAVLDKAAGFANWRLSATFLASLRSGIDNRVLVLAPTPRPSKSERGKTVFSRCRQTPQRLLDSWPFQHPSDGDLSAAGHPRPFRESQGAAYHEQRPVIRGHVASDNSQPASLQHACDLVFCEMSAPPEFSPARFRVIFSLLDHMAQESTMAPEAPAKRKLLPHVPDIRRPQAVPRRHTYKADTLTARPNGRVLAPRQNVISLVPTHEAFSPKSL